MSPTPSFLKIALLLPVKNYNLSSDQTPDTVQKMKFTKPIGDLTKMSMCIPEIYISINYIHVLQIKEHRPYTRNLKKTGDIENG